MKTTAKKTATKKTTKKAEKEPALIVNLVDVTDPADAVSRVAYAKVSVGKAINEDELNAIVQTEYSHFIDELFGVYNALVRTSDGLIEQLTATKVPSKKVGYWKNLWNAIRGKR